MHAIHQDLRINTSRNGTHEGRAESIYFSPFHIAAPNAADHCFNWMESLSKWMGHFLIRRYADFHMFFRSCRSMVGGTTQRDIDFRIYQITQLIVDIEHCGNNRNAVKERFQSFSPQIRDLFFYVDQNYIDAFVNNDSLQAHEEAEEIIRECKQIISFQHQLSVVNTIYRMFCERRRTTRTFRDSGGGVIHSPRSPRPEPETPGGINVNIPGTIPYVQGGIPEAIQNKANQINRLKEAFADLHHRPVVPSIYNDIIMEEGCMEIPLFDASHPVIQNALAAAAAPGATAETIAAVNDRSIRHFFDKEVLEEHMRIRSSPKCPLCRHPEDGAIDPEHLRIDTDLQDQIFQFLTRAVRDNEQGRE
jgi:hypothetical protein